jgi:hypothetical protein
LCRCKMFPMLCNSHVEKISLITTNVFGRQIHNLMEPGTPGSGAIMSIMRKYSHVRMESPSLMWDTNMLGKVLSTGDFGLLPSKIAWKKLVWRRDTQRFCRNLRAVASNYEIYNRNTLRKFQICESERCQTSDKISSRHYEIWPNAVGGVHRIVR